MIPTGVIALFALAVAVLSCSVTLLVLHERRAKPRDICGDVRPASLLGPPLIECQLPDGHRSLWHRGEDGSQWTETGMVQR